MTEEKPVGLWIKVMTKNKGLHLRFIDDVFEEDVEWMSVEEVTKDETKRIFSYDCSKMQKQ